MASRPYVLMLSGCVRDNWCARWNESPRSILYPKGKRSSWPSGQVTGRLRYGQNNAVVDGIAGSQIKYRAIVENKFSTEWLSMGRETCYSMGGFFHIFGMSRSIQGIRLVQVKWKFWHVCLSVLNVPCQTFVFTRTEDNFLWGLKFSEKYFFHKPTEWQGGSGSCCNRFTW